MSQAEIPFKEGDVVQHKTGGPAMIYVGKDDLGRCLATWMVGGQKRSDTFIDAELRHYEEPSGSTFVGRTTRV
ncbi:DUF2158 domain-containing protein [Devosia riboflavina]